MCSAKQFKAKQELQYSANDFTFEYSFDLIYQTKSGEEIFF